MEELVIALADNFWKGKRNNQLEHQCNYQLLDRDDWETFIALDSYFEEIAAIAPY